MWVVFHVKQLLEQLAKQAGDSHYSVRQAWDSDWNVLIRALLLRVTSPAPVRPAPSVSRETATEHLAKQTGNSPWSVFLGLEFCVELAVVKPGQGLRVQAAVAP